LGAAVILGRDRRRGPIPLQARLRRFNGTAAIPVWSDNTVRVRLNRGGNRTVDTALHMMAVTRSRGLGRCKDHLDKLLATGKTPTEALLADERHPHPARRGQHRAVNTVTGQLDGAGGLT